MQDVPVQLLNIHETMSTCLLAAAGGMAALWLVHIKQQHHQE